MVVTNQIVISTPKGRGAVANVLVHGSDATELVQRHFVAAAGKPLSQLKVGRIYYGHWQGGLGDETKKDNAATSPAEDVVVCRRSEKQVEVNCHGGLAAARAIADSLRDESSAELPWQTWLKESSTDPILAAARHALAQAPTLRTANILLDQHAGALRRTIDGAIKTLRAGDEAIGAEILEQLLRRARLGRHLTEPWKVVFAGPPNVGKSSLINAVLGYQRSLVFDQPGTTRDVVTATTAIDGWPVELADSAGLHAATDEVEQAGIALAQAEVAKADLVVLIYDISQPLTPELEKLWEQHPDALVIFNKGDLPPADLPEKTIGPTLTTSAVTGEGIERLIELIGRHLVPQPPPDGVGVPFREDQVAAIRRAHNAVAKADISTAIEILESLSSCRPC